MAVNSGNSDRNSRRQSAQRQGDCPIQPFAAEAPRQSSAGRGLSPRMPPATNAVEPPPVGAAQVYPASLTEPFHEPAAPPPPRSRRLRKGPIARFWRSLGRLFSAVGRWLKWLVSTWQFLLVTGFLVCLSSASLAVALIIQLPGLPNCPAVFWPLASASMRFECARIAASKQTATDLLEAIALVDGLPANHAMRAEADRLIELWSQEVLKLADESFHQGNLTAAIAAARKIPAKVTAYRLVEERVKSWEQTWAAAEAIYHKAEAALRKRDWRGAFAQAIQLLEVNNKYWQTTRYDDLNQRINTARADGNKLFKAEWLADSGDLASLKEAIKLAQEIRPDSYIYALAQVKIQAFGRQMLDLAQKSLERENLQEALSIINQIPVSAKVESEKRDLTILANARSNVWLDTVAGLEEAISQAQRVLPGRPYYGQAQTLITRWQYEIEGLAQLERARLLAQNQTAEGYAAAIAAASQVGAANPRWQEAQREIQKWQAATQTLTDQPLLDQAEQFASAGDVNALQAAVNQASQITPGRSLYSAAQQKIQQWNRQIQRIQDQPLLDQARALAFSGNVQTAIDLAERIRPGRSLYDAAQSDVAKWRGQIQAQVDQIQAQNAQAQAQRNLQDARQLASVGNPVGLANAIRMASQVTASGAIQTEINAAINDWSWQLLQLARDQANAMNVSGAIGIAQRIPARSAAYAEAQAQIQSWQTGRP